MKSYRIENETINIKELLSVDKTIFFRKVTPKFFSHDEDEYHIESKVELILNYINEEDAEEKRSVIFYKEHQIEYIGQEVEVEIEEFVEILEETEEFKKSKERLNETIKTLLNS